MTTKKNKSWIAGLLTAVAASLCCITPVLAFLGGASGLASSFSWMDPYRPYLICLTIAIFAFAWYKKLKPQKQVDCDCEADNKKSFWQSKSFLAIVTIIAGLLIAFPYYAKIFYSKPQETKVIIVDKANIATVQLNISGMDCEGCTAHINGELSKVNGVIEANTSYKNGNAIVKFDNSKTSADTIANSINSIGYKVTSSTIIDNK
ncbi:mercuric transport protein MerTP [Terrimonas sp.]|jgi:copper chaperone CopZ|uniref:Mercuric transport protein MerT n=1 Tax=Pelobium manganitolerans TaxID=1842495 RepID=A0A419S4T7_9SPHI|nr:mercuric transport protein MerTP [Pelobium manganitolerans]MBN9484556.1 mercuric transport protein MerTP [Bacteroidota bacterium]MBX3255652.1 mercuric transport protein MerTP [Chitinophagaceae bacterium]PVD50157.1 mercuric transport protein MerTP [Terrimonas sp.]MBS1748859.1 mercuric transport protein MerTP [Bacteroidota bacterium]RKD15139.1 heavy metal transporter [Pelobium manganitolerans]